MIAPFKVDGPAREAIVEQLKKIQMRIKNIRTHVGNVTRNGSEN